MKDNIRRQLTLFVDQADAESIENIRRKFNPVQFELIKCHVTLCREDEIERLDEVMINLTHLTHTEIVVKFGVVKRFNSGKGVLLPAQNDNLEFESLRRQILNGIIDNPRKQEPHVTLMHPRNSTCTDDIYRQIKEMKLPSELIFKTVSLIEQKDMGPWRTLKKFELIKN